MKRNVLIILLVAACAFSAAPQDGKTIVKKAYELMQGQTNQAVMTMTIARPTWQRTITFKTWAKGADYSLALITEPQKDKGQAFLKRGNEIWNWVPNIQRMIKLPPSMMSQGWMGSDYSNDDLLKESSIVEDYDHLLVGVEKIGGEECFKVKMAPKANSAVVWGYVIKWISKDGYIQMKSEYYDEDALLVKTEVCSNVKVMGDRKIPTRIEVIPSDKPGNKTIVEIKSIVFNKPLDDSFFSQQNMKTIR